MLVKQIEQQAANRINEVCEELAVRLVINVVPVDVKQNDGSIIVGKQYVVGVEYIGSEDEVITGEDNGIISADSTI